MLIFEQFNKLEQCHQIVNVLVNMIPCIHRHTDTDENYLLKNGKRNSFLPCDRSFGAIELEKRKHVKIYLPKNYIKMIKNTT